MECMFCESENVEVITTFENKKFVKCLSCYSSGPIFDTEEEAITLWNYVLICVKQVTISEHVENWKKVQAQNIEGDEK